MQFFDTHAHIGLIYDDPVRQISVIQQAKQAGVTRIISINNSILDFKKEYAFSMEVISGVETKIELCVKRKKSSVL